MDRNDRRTGYAAVSTLTFVNGFFALLVAVVWAFVLGAVFGWILDRPRPA